MTQSLLSFSSFCLELYLKLWCDITSSLCGGVAEIILKSQSKMSLKCLAAQSIRRFNLDYQGQVLRVSIWNIRPETCKQKPETSNIAPRKSAPCTLYLLVNMSTSAVQIFRSTCLTLLSIWIGNSLWWSKLVKHENHFVCLSLLLWGRDQPFLGITGVQS